MQVTLIAKISIDHMCNAMIQNILEDTVVFGANSLPWLFAWPAALQLARTLTPSAIAICPQWPSQPIVNIYSQAKFHLDNFDVTRRVQLQEKSVYNQSDIGTFPWHQCCYCNHRNLKSDCFQRSGMLKLRFVTIYKHHVVLFMDFL